MKGALIALTIALAGCSFPDSPGAEIDYGDRYYGCYTLPNDEIVEVTSDALSFLDRDQSFEISFRKDKFGDLISARPPLYLRDGEGFPFIDVSGLGSIIRFSNDDTDSSLLIPDRSGGHITARKVACPK